MIKLHRTLPLSLALTAMMSLGITGCDKTKDDSANNEAAVAGSQTVDSPQNTDASPDSERIVSDEVMSQADTDASADAITNTTQAAGAAGEEANSALPTVLTDNTPVSALGNNQPSLVTNPVQPDTPEATVKAALDTLYYGDAKDAANYYQVDMANFSEELAKTQYAFQQTVEAVTITKTTYNEDKTQAQIEGELMLKGQEDPAPLAYTMKKIDGVWKILG